MPPFEDIAWKFVSRVNARKWRCPHCKTEYSGTVTRVKSHLLKIPSKGIASCTKVPEPISKLMRWLLDEVRDKDDIAWKFVNRLGDNKWLCHYCSEEFFGDLTGVKGHLLKVPNAGISICTEVPDPVRNLMLSLLDEVAEEESREVAEGQSREANRQSSTEPQSRDMPTQAEVDAEEESREANGQFSTGPLFSPGFLEYMEQSNFSQQRREANGQLSMEPKSHDMLTQAEVAAEEQTREANGQSSMEPKSCERLPPASLMLPRFEDAEQYSKPLQWLTDMAKFTYNKQQGELHETLAKQSRAQNSHGESTSCSTMALAEVALPQCCIQSKMQMNVQQTPAGSSSFQYDQIPAVGNSKCLQDCNQHSRLRTPMDIDPSIASRHTIDSHIFEATIANLQVSEVATNTTGPSSSSQDMNRGSLIMNIQSTKDEEVRNLKRTVEGVNDKEAVMKEQMEIESDVESDASSVWKKTRILAEESVRETERARNNFQIIGQAKVETLPPKGQVETLTREAGELIEPTLPQKLLIEARDAKGGPFLEQKLKGEAIHWNIELIWNYLEKNHVSKLGIYGMGGVGKTTIMMRIHNRLLKDAAFDGVLFITVSQDFSIYKLQSDIWKALKFGVMEDEHVKKRAAILSDHLERKKNCVLILDDVWQHFKLQDVGIPNRAGLKVVITTRFVKVCLRMDCEEMIKIQPLGREEAWKLFVEELGPKPLTNMQFEKVARKIANRCAGLPLAVNTMASVLRGEKNFSVWRDILNKMERSHTRHTEMGDKVLPVLTLSYERLSDPQVKQCFLFCALFPEDISIPHMQLIEYFIDEGFLDEADTREEQYCRGLAIVDTLQNACLLEFDHGRIGMHYLIREMALHIMSTAYMVKAGQGLRRMPDGEYWTKDLEKVSLMQGSIKDIPPDLSPNCPKLSTLLLNESLNLKNMQIRDSFFRNMRGLKVLNLSQCYALTKLPESLLELANLRALVLRGCRVLCRIPYLGKLKFLRKLDVNGCSSLLEVKGLEELRNLRYLDLAESGIERLLKGALRRMVNLQYLSIAGMVKVKANEVIRLKALERLKCYFGNVDNFNEYVRIIEKSGRHDYSLIVDQENRLWSVSAYVYSDPEILPENKMKYDEDYHRYKSVEIRSCNYAMARVVEEMNNDSILIPGDVEFFMLRNWHGMTNLSGMGQLLWLKVLRIKEWDNSVVLFGEAGVDKEEACNTCDSPVPPFPSLETLEIEGCSKLKYLFGHESRFSLPLLREVSISRCEGIEGMTTSVAISPELGGPAFPRLESIILENCNNMKRVLGSEWLSHFPNLTTIRVKNCNNIKELLPYEGLFHLPNLKHIEVHGCEGIEELISGGGEHHVGSAPLNTPSSSLPSPFSPLKLRRLLLQRLPQLKSIYEGPLSFIPEAFVQVYNCPKLKKIPPQGSICSNYIWL